jgi:hypothetical protein
VSRHIAARATGLGLVAVLAVAGCASEPSPSDSIATFRVADGSTYKVLIVDSGDLEIVDKLSKGEDAPSIPNGAIVRETGVNADWSWSIDPYDFGFSDVVDADCQATPQEIEDGTFQGDRFCPWSAIVIALEPVP